MRKIATLEAWKVGRLVSVQAYRLASDGAVRRHYAFADQLRRAALSIPCNIAEGYGLGTRAQLVRHLRIALGSAYETDTLLGLAPDLDICTRERIAQVGSSCNRLIRLLVGLLKHFGARVPG